RALDLVARDPAARPFSRRADDSRQGRRPPSVARFRSRAADRDGEGLDGAIVISILLALAAIQSTATPAPPVAAEENPAAVAAPDAAAEARYRACTAQVRSEPQRAIDTANAWQRAGGGLLARQCHGLAFVALERWEMAAIVYEQA